MEKAYDISDLAMKLKGRGLDIAEEGAKIVTEEMFSWLQESAALSATPYDDLLSAIYPMIKSELMKAIDKIDGQVG